MKPVEKEALPLFQGQEHKIKCPDYRTVTLRETNGNDDEILSKMADASTGENSNKFLSDIITYDDELGRKPTVDDVRGYPVNTKYYLLMVQRVINHGPKLHFERECLDEKCKDPNGNRTVTEYDVDILEDHGNDFENREKYRNDGGQSRVKEYPLGNAKEIFFAISSGKNFKCNILTGESEKELLEMPIADQTQNTKLYVRKLSVKNGDQYILLTSFHGISSREMSEIRGYVDKYDPQFDPDVMCQCKKCKLVQPVALFSLRDFFFPVPPVL